MKAKRSRDREGMSEAVSLALGSGTESEYNHTVETLASAICHLPREWTLESGE